MLSFTAACVCAVVFIDKVDAYFEQHGWICYMCTILVMVGMYLQTCMDKYFRPFPYNYLLLVYFTLAWSGMVAGFCAFQEPQMILLSTIMTALMTISLTLVACCVNSEMTWCYGIGATILLSIWPAIIFAVLNPSKTLSTILAMFGTVLASCYIIIDTEKIVGNYLEEDEYVFGALALYKDILVLFLSLLEILGSTAR